MTTNLAATKARCHQSERSARAGHRRDQLEPCRLVDDRRVSENLGLRRIEGRAKSYISRKPVSPMCWLPNSSANPSTRNCCVAAGGGGVDGHRALGCEAVEVAGAPGFGAGAGKGFAAKGLHADDGADHAAVDVAVADPKPREDVAHGFVYSAVDAEGEAVAGRGDLVEHLVEAVGLPAHDMEDRAEYLAPEPRRAVDLEGLRRERCAVPMPDTGSLAICSSL
jgi:hypothetical protein